MKKIILLLLMFFPLCGAERVNGYPITPEYEPQHGYIHIDTNQIQRKQLIKSNTVLFDKTSCPYLGTELTHCKDTVWLSNGIILAHGFLKQDNKEPEEAVVSIDTNHNYATKVLCTLLKTTNSHIVYITADEKRSIAVISLPHTTLIYENDRAITDIIQLKSISRPAVISANEVIFFNDKGCNTYDGTNVSPFTALNNAIQKALQSLTDATEKLNGLKTNFCNHSNHLRCLISKNLENKTNKPQVTVNDISINWAEIAKIPTRKEFFLTLLWAIFKWNTESNRLEQLSLPDSTIYPIDMPVTAYDIQCHSQGNHTAITYDVPYNGWLLNKSQPLLVLQEEKENSETEKYRKQYIDNPTHANGTLLIEAAWKNTDHIDSKAFHPTLTVIATLAKQTGLLKYWNAKGDIIIKQNLPFQSGIEPHDCLPRRLSFSPNGEQIACGLDEALVIVNVPQQVLNYKD